ncbi:MAG: TetR/AcrR family transcriptional regulator [Bacteroides sp.]|nr:TetR/AcrR family transcriptional regulator [Bacteroides sp.]
MVSKTRERFIEVARQLFARKGVENTTMNDIASASDKGRRTIYTYFKSKRDIFNAVIETETAQVLGRLKEIVARPVPANEKLLEYVECRFETMKEIVSRNGSLRAGFFRDVRKVDRARKIMASKEVALLRAILNEGVEQGVFEIRDTNSVAVVITQVIAGLDVPYIRDNLSENKIDKEALKTILGQLLLFGITGRGEGDNPI